MDLSVTPWGKPSKSRSRRRTEHPIGLLASIIAQNPRGSAAEHIAAFKSTMLLESYADYALAVADEWCRIKYSTAHAAAIPPTPEEIEARRKERKARQKAEQAAIDRARVKLVGNVLACVMPNGKPLGKCTGPECMAFGGWFTKVGTIVGVEDVPSNRQVIKLASAARGTEVGAETLDRASPKPALAP